MNVRSILAGPQSCVEQQSCQEQKDEHGVSPNVIGGRRIAGKQAIGSLLTEPEVIRAGGIVVRRSGAEAGEKGGNSRTAKI